MRVLFVSPAAGLGGSERSLLDLLAALGDASPELERTLLLLVHGELGERARALGVRVEVAPLPDALARLGESRRNTAGSRANAPDFGRGVLAALGYARTFRQQVKRCRPHLLHTNGIKAHLLAAMLAPDLPRVVHFRDFASGRPLTQRLLPVLGWRSIVVANSRAVEADLRQCAPSLRTRVIYNGIDVDDFRPGPATGSLAALAGMPPPAEGTLNIGLVATYAWWKGHRRFLEAAADVSSAAAGRPLRFYVVGGPIYDTSGSEVTEGELRALVDARGLKSQVGFVPFQTNAAPVYRELDIVVHASERPEPFGRTIVEAMACGRAVVVARAGGAVELFSDRRDALGYEPDEPGALARAVLELATDDALRHRIGVAARESAVARFDRRRLGPELLGVYRELVGERVS